ncbi:hypothetical protein AQUCO_08600021v1 [Aquilegia coerulea]|uniref:Bet v I/Major latex protein domain-containing protein n=1 Tax=Aquilegia coerulea TaxID=218851 RepID=A0A2G5C6H0_AQUCA|nr:hypothetical protein AQUCO_08600021v1 [Aquilegia coerulea]
MAEQQKWHGKLSAKLTSSTVDQIWPLLADFCNVHKWVPTVECEHVQGSPDPGQPGCIRHIFGPPEEDNTERPAMSIYERLLTIDPVERCLIYEVTKSNMGFKTYVATVKVLRGDNDNPNGCVIDWSYVCDPIKCWKSEDLFSMISAILDSMTKTMGEATKR